MLKWHLRRWFNPSTSCSIVKVYLISRTMMSLFITYNLYTVRSSSQCIRPPCVQVGGRLALLFQVRRKHPSLCFNCSGLMFFAVCYVPSRKIESDFIFLGTIYNYLPYSHRFTLSAWWSTKDVRIWRLQTSYSDVFSRSPLWKIFSSRRHRRWDGGSYGFRLRFLLFPITLYGNKLR